jgi:hypothetical protein
MKSSPVESALAAAAGFVVGALLVLILWSLLLSLVPPVPPVPL